MNFQQLRSVREAVRRGFNLTEVAQTLNTSQPGVSRQIRELEDELGIELFVRVGKRLTGLTEPGSHVLPIIERILLNSHNLRKAGQEYVAPRSGQLSVAATHSQARYALPRAVKQFSQHFPEIRLHLHQGTPQQVAAMLLAGEADVGIATEALAQFEGLVALPCYRWSHSLVVPPGHELLQHDGPVTLSRLAEFPLITYDTGYTGRSHIDEAFAHHQVQPEIALTAMDADVIKTYAELGMGVGIVASMAFDPLRDKGLRALDASHLFGFNLTRLAVRSGTYLRSYEESFIEAFAPSLTAGVVRAALDEGRAPTRLAATAPPPPPPPPPPEPWPLLGAAQPAVPALAD
ncbi:CysB family HTH-type transcriptional regulator [Curvibacter gracilis]|uniref:CysB family HTH-type transcriptional regulator n=1 Tax=Curvibacter gracilis TaxID=230310 RepID=UPI000484EB97|nr:CysB family HTH-type transcriptional regulator [Curvibacter gracilis]